MPFSMGLCPGQSYGTKTSLKIGDALAAFMRALGRVFTSRVTAADRWLALDAEWHKLGDNTLRDIGLSRTDVHYVEPPETHAPDRPA